MRILIGHSLSEHAAFDPDRYDVQVAPFGKDGRKPPESIAEMLAQCPPGWKPDVYLHPGTVFFPIPTDIEAFDGLTVTTLQDWQRSGRTVWAGAGFFDLVLTERRPCALLKASGYQNAVFARLFGANPE